MCAEPFRACEHDLACLLTWASHELCEAGGWGPFLLIVVREAKAGGGTHPRHTPSCMPPPNFPCRQPGAVPGAGDSSRLVSVHISSNVGGRQAAPGYTQSGAP